jgi:iron complex outermembrane receptor protein
LKLVPLAAAALAAGTVLAPNGAAAQAGTPPAAAPAPAPAAEPGRPPAPAGPQQLDRVEIRGGQNSTEERRQSTASKIIVGRDEIERFGDATVGEILRRLPGVTMGGAPGRGGRPAMRGMANFTQLLVDGQRVPPGFSIDSINPEQIERIEILRAPTAETGTRAIAGTINIVTREGFVRRLNELVLNFGHENGRFQPGASWTRNDSVGRLIYNVSVGVNRSERRNDALTTTVEENLVTGLVQRAQRETAQELEERTVASVSGRLQYRLDGGVLILAPFLLSSRGSAERNSQLSQSLGATPPLYATSATTRDGGFDLGRLNGTWRQRLASGLRLEANLNAGQGTFDGQSARSELDAAGAPLRRLTDDSRTTNRNVELRGKASYDLGSGHALVAGTEVENLRRSERRVTLQNGQPQATDFGENLEARSSRLALYAQDEWNPSPKWSAYAGLRWESIDTEGQGSGDSMPKNRSSVFSPLAHAVYKPDPNGRDQVRMSLTRSYRSPNLGDLIARPSLSGRYPVDGANTATAPDRAGNPALRPELATGVELGVERYLRSGGMLSANLFYRDISGLIRALTTLETVSWSPVPRWVARPQNIGGASTAGIELEAKFRLDELVKDAPRLELHGNLSLFRSRVEQVPGPDNRLDQQPDFSLNLGADYRVRGWPLTVGANYNLVPAYDTRLSATQLAELGRKQVVDAYAQWTFNPQLRLRFTVSNALAEDFLIGSQVLLDAATREVSRTVQPTTVNYRLRLELRL